MAEKWYPVIDYMTCTECGACTQKCAHGVYDKAKAPTPVVVNPGACIDRCKGCGSLCPVGAISYVGEGCGCSDEACHCGEKTARIQYLYLDLTTCDRCVGTDAVLDEVMEVLTPALTTAGYKVSYEKTEMATQALAREYEFLSSPTIRVNGRDICRFVSESKCGCCGEISGTDVSCRVFEYEGKTYEVPPREMLAGAILETLFMKDCGLESGEAYEMPRNLKDFFEGKRQKACCTGSCC